MYTKTKRSLTRLENNGYEGIFDVTEELRRLLDEDSSWMFDV